MATYEQLIDQDLASLGITTAGQAGALGNFQVESNFNPAAYNPNENAHGIAQWEGGRYSNGLAVYARQHGLSVDSIQADLGYLNQELEGPYNAVLQAGRKATDPAAYAQIWQSMFEGSTVASLPQRQANAVQIYNGGHLALASPVASTGPGSVPAAQPASLTSSIPIPIGPGLFIQSPNLGALSGTAADVGKGIASGVGTVISGIAHPITQFLEDSALIIFGLIFLLVGLVIVAHHVTGYDPTENIRNPKAAPAEEEAAEAAA